MGMIGQILGLSNTGRDLGQAVQGVAEVFTVNKTRAMEARAAAYRAALDQMGSEFEVVREGPFNRFVDALNRLPRPALALGTLGLFAYAMAEPTGFGTRMQSLALVPEPLWWLLGAIVSFYFGARELHYRRMRITPPVAGATHADFDEADGDANAALHEWRSQRVAAK